VALGYVLYEQIQYLKGNVISILTSVFVGAIVGIVSVIAIGELMGAAMVQIAFNLGNAVGAYCGGLPIRAGLTYEYPALVGILFVALGLVSTGLFCKKYASTNQ
jgi:predicted MFS family arabinose efflux permease